MIDGAAREVVMDFPTFKDYPELDRIPKRVRIEVRDGRAWVYRSDGRTSMDPDDGGSYSR